ncbi:hypothetical protein C7967_102275 [Thalassospira sp. 11-3]|jgi:hypothetical protein|nr:hypothetical protein KO164_0798 [Thalassospira sp. KO164]PXX34219.1 hypothetical protein C7967_102275 [Thalassospira sp. 11-3]SED77303.1 hypothetical protein SAMN04515623_0801 [Thalassospira permensis]|tara:strand:- start:631 stop:762 length:132 start_codon:yes stop_codon:yes gene_type:complete
MCIPLSFTDLAAILISLTDFNEDSSFYHGFSDFDQEQLAKLFL